MAASHLHPYESASTPYLPQPPVDAAPVGDKRTDGRSLEQFRPICESADISAMSPIQTALCVGRIARSVDRPAQ